MKLFEDFKPTSTKEWEQLILKDLKGGDYEKKLITKTMENINIKPYYRIEDLEGLEYLESSPGEFPFTRGSKTEFNNYEIRQDIFVGGYEEAAEKSIEIISKGVNSIGFIICMKEDVSKTGFFSLLKNIDLEKIRINFYSGEHSLITLKYLLDYIEENKLQKNKVKASFSFDPFGFKTISGDFYSKKKSTDIDMLFEMFNLVNENYSEIKILNINGLFYRNAGSSAVQEVAFVLNNVTECLSEMAKRGLKPQMLIKNIMLTLGIGANYFIEIAKIRATRLLFSKTLEMWNNDNTNHSDVFIHSITSGFNKTAYDPFVNVLRATTETMSAIIGGSNSITAKPYDSSYKATDEFSERIARNIPIILKEEAKFDKTIDPSAGSYYIENLTNSIAENALSLFLEIEKEKGYFEALKKGIIQDIINETLLKRENNIALRKEILLGTNQYADASENVLETIDDDIYYKKGIPINDNSDIKPLRFKRGALKFEELRFETEKLAKKPKVFLLTYGNIAMRKARATFATNFFANAGYQIIENTEFSSIEKASEIAIKENADITVICSSDDEYEQIAPTAFEMLKDKTIFVVAGYPKNLIEDFENKGINNFIHVKTNILSTLNSFHSKLK